MLVRRLWQQSEAGHPAILLGRPAEGPDWLLFERLLERGVLRHAGQLTAWDTCPGCECGRDDRPIRWIDGRPSAVCIADRSHDLALSPDDLVSFEIVIEELVAAAAVASGYGERPQEISPGIWRIGRLPNGRILHIVPTRAALHRPGLVGSLRQAEPTRDIQLLGTGLDQSLQAELERQRIHFTVLADVTSASGTLEPLALDLSSIITGGGKPIRLRLLVAEKAVILDDRKAKLTAGTFRLLQLFAQRLLANTPIVSVSDIKSALFSPTTSDARSRDLVRDVRKALSRRLLASNGLIETRSNIGYTLALSATEVSIEP